MEIAQLVLGILTPVLLLALGIPIARYTKRIETQATLDERLIERRLALFDEIAPALNDLFCLARFVGHFRSIDPAQVIDLKRRLDRTFHVNRPIFSGAVMSAYDGFMDAIFDTYEGAGEDAKLRIDRARLARERGGLWDQAWDERFSDDPPTPPDVVGAAYFALVDALGRDFGGRRA